MLLRYAHPKKAIAECFAESYPMYHKSQSIRNAPVMIRFDKLSRDEIPWNTHYSR